MRLAFTVAALVTLSAISPAADSKYTVKVETSAPPKELAEPIRAHLSDKAMTVLDARGKVLCTIWPVKSLDPKGKPAEGAGLKYTQIDETTIVGAVQFPATWTDYRKQKVKPGVYTMRLAIQPMDGDHMGTAPYNEFVLLCPAAEDKKAETLEVEKMHELSAKSAGRKHPCMMLLFPNKTPAEAPVVQDRANDHTLLSYRVPVTTGGEKTSLGFSVVVVGVTMAE
jgi:hypothetical protein